MKYCSSRYLKGAALEEGVFFCRPARQALAGGETVREVHFVLTVFLPVPSLLSLLSAFLFCIKYRIEKHYTKAVRKETVRMQNSAIYFSL
jgi:hypothetical protein